ncbi:MAG: HlyC/CorC family transporter [Nitrospirae bacterium]|nr:HlyC/CorC family transporter [Nitrospirota bacterium]
MTIGLVLLVSLLFILMEGFFSGSEIAILSCDKIRVKQRSAEGSTAAQLILGWMQHPSRLLSTTLLGTNLAVVLNTVFVTSVILSGGFHHAELLTTFLLGPVVLLFGEILPKSVFQAYATPIALRVAPPLQAVSWILTPLIYVLDRYGRLLGRRKETLRITRDELVILLGRRGGDVKDVERRIIHRIYRFATGRVKDAMVPLAEVAALPETASVGQAVGLILHTGHTRIPVFRERIDHLVGVLRSYELIDQVGSPHQPIRAFVRKPLYVPETKPLVGLLELLKERGVNMAIAVDEFGGAVGFLTREDIVEEIVGEIEDEYDEGRRRWEERDGGTAIDARMDIEHVNEVLGLNLPLSEDYETLAGFVLDRMGRVPKVGDEFKFNGIQYKVTKATPTQVKEVEVRAPDGVGEVSSTSAGT